MLVGSEPMNSSLRAATHFILSTPFLLFYSSDVYSNSQERERLETFSSHRWNQGDPKPRHWDRECWDFVVKTDGKWKWIGFQDEVVKSQAQKNAVEFWCVNDDILSSASSEGACTYLGGQVFNSKSDAYKLFFNRQEQSQISPSNVNSSSTHTYAPSSESESSLFEKSAQINSLELGDSYSVSRIKSVLIAIGIASSTYEYFKLIVFGVMGVFAIFFLRYFFRISKKKRLKRLQEIRLYVDDVKRADSDLRRNEYLSHQQMLNWISAYSGLRNLFNYEQSLLKHADLFEQIERIKKVCEGPDDWRENRNKDFIVEEQKRFHHFFNSIEKYPLTEKQISAVLTNENKCLTVAGAGTGKTSTVVGRVGYLLETKWCAPEEILVISYTKETVQELEKRFEQIAISGVDIKTFHKTGFDIVKEVSNVKPVVFEYPPIIDYLEQLSKSEAGLSALIDFLAYFYYPEKNDVDFGSQKEANQFATYHNLEGLKEDQVTLRRERVKSIQELKIANWLFLNGINYEYEARYPYGSDSYQPDFYLPDFDIYIEHFGVNRDGSTRKDIDRHKYNSQMEWKRHKHATHETTLVETYSYEFNEGTVFDLIKDRLIKLGVDLKPLPLDEVRRLNSVTEKFRGLAKILGVFLSHYRSDPERSANLLKIFRGEKYRRESRFLKIFDEVITLYEADLNRKKAVDFDDMIGQATEALLSGSFVNPYKAVIVDEYQDISRSRARLLDAFHFSTPDLRLLCVGDDWQSIYRFSGGDVQLMTNYQTENPHTARIDLDRSFRFNDKILELSEKFVTRNPAQLTKTITTTEKRKDPVVHITSSPVEAILRDLGERDDAEDVFVLGRFNFTEAVETFGGQRVLFNRLKVEGKTVHKSKGLEADYVVIDNMISDKFGFPSGVQDDPLISLLLPGEEKFPHAEERRLFYVAITRARKEVWITVPESKCPSEFVEELIKDKQRYKGLVRQENTSIAFDLECPVCGSTMIERTHSTTGSRFVGCAHYPRCKGIRPGCVDCSDGFLLREEDRVSCTNEDCQSNPKNCPECETGILQLKRGQYGLFFGCSAFVYGGCRYKESALEANVDEQD
jgi:DNA helicase IV